MRCCISSKRRDIKFNHHAARFGVAARVRELTGQQLILQLYYSYSSQQVQQEIRLRAEPPGDMPPAESLDWAWRTTHPASLLVYDIVDPESREVRFDARAIFFQTGK